MSEFVCPAEVLDEAVVLAHATGWPKEGPLRDGDAAHRFLTEVMASAAPVIFEAGRAAEREFWQARIEGAAQAFEDIADQPEVAKVIRTLVLIDQGEGESGE